MFPLPEFSNALRDEARSALSDAARYIQGQQTWHEWPFWTADAGRIPHTRNHKNPSERPVMSLTWDSARSAQALLSAYRISGDESLIETARRALEYVKINQIFAPEFPQHRGAQCEETPLTDHISTRDTVEAIQGFINMYVVTKDEVCLQRAQIAAEWFADRFMMGGGWPNAYIYFRDNDRLDVCNDFSRMMLSAVTLVFAQLDAITGEKRYAKRIPDAMDWVIENALEADGSLRIHDGTDVGHHASTTGPLAYCFVNDDGINVSLIACWRATGDEKYKEAAVRNGEWWLGTEVLPTTYSAIPSAMSTFLDLYRLTSDKRYLEKAQTYAREVLKLQHKAPGNELHGGFIGEDGLHLEGSKPEDHISLRTTMYAIMGLAKLAASKEEEWNLAYSAFGW